MFLKFYNLKKQPFHITPDPDFLYLSPSHKEALSAIIYGIEERKGFVAIIGAVGVGKTTILRSYLETADRKHLKTIYVFNSRLTFKGLLKTIYQELGLLAESDDDIEMVNRLYEFLIEEYRQGNTVVLVIDEAQNMPIDTLESLRMISNLETSRDKLIQIVLVGQLEFEVQLNHARLRQLKQRLAIRSTIQPLTRDESLQYVGFRLQKAGSNHNSIFTNCALRKIISKAKGIPRVLNILCDNALITGFGYQRKPVTRKIVREIIRDFEGSTRSFFGERWLPGAVALAALLVVIGLPYKWNMISETRLLMPIEQAERYTAVQDLRLKETLGAKGGREQRTLAKGVVPPILDHNGTTGITKTIAPGDTLSRLAQEIYGNASARIVKLIKEGNPHIEDPDIICVGSTITFPNVPLQSSSRRRPNE